MVSEIEMVANEYAPRVPPDPNSGQPRLPPYGPSVDAEYLAFLKNSKGWAGELIAREAMWLGKAVPTVVIELAGRIRATLDLVEPATEAYHAASGGRIAMAIPQQLTPDQQDVVNARARTTLVIAPAGSGKTEVLIRRIERLLDESPGESFRLLAVTFTVKASDELKSRVSRSVGEEAWRVDANTIHGFALDWLQRSGQPVGISPDVVVYAQSRDCVHLLRLFLDSVEESQLDDRTLLDILEQINDLRTRLVKPSEAPNQSFSGSSFQLAELYEAYLTALDNTGGIDFPGMLVKLLDLFEADPAVLRRMQRTYHQILVDEGQDLTHAQAELLRRIVGDALELFVVADDRQSINGWAGWRHGSGLRCSLGRTTSGLSYSTTSGVQLESFRSPARLPITSIRPGQMEGRRPARLRACYLRVRRRTLQKRHT